MEKKFTVKVKDSHLIYGVLNSIKSTKKIIVFVHGLTGHKNEHLFYNAAQFFPKKGFDTFRFDLYTGENKGRKLIDCSISTHAEDVNNVIKRLQKIYKEIYLVGHSLGGPSILFADQTPVESIVLWEPSFEMDADDHITFDKKLKLYRMEWGTEVLLSKEMIQEWEKTGDVILSYFAKPTKIICASNGVLSKEWKKRLKHIPVKNDFVSIPGASHCFDEEGAEEKLFVETLKWFSKK